MKWIPFVFCLLLLVRNAFGLNTEIRDSGDFMNNPLSRVVEESPLLSRLHSNQPDARPAKTRDGDEDVGFSVGRNWRGVISPGSDLYPVYLANPTRPTMAINWLKVTDSEIPDSGNSRYLLRLGGRWNCFRIHPQGDPYRGVQLDIEAAFLGQFDADNSLDNIGWDGVWGLLLSWADGKGFALKTGIQHDSSHVGDEYAERTGRKRINYTRAEVVFGSSFSFLEHWRVYGEGGHAYDMRNEELQEPWRVEGGLEFEDPGRFWKGRLGYYAAIDFTSFEESDWEWDITIQAGFVLPFRNPGQTLRLGLEYRDGRCVIGEFFQNNETYWALGLWLDW